MAAKKKGLGRGLDALLSASETVSTGSVNESSDAESGLRWVAVHRIERGSYQPRTQFDEEGLRELADSIKAQGMIQPIVVRPRSEGRYELLVGERRWRAAQLAGLESVPTVVRELEDRDAAAIALIENIQRQDLNPLEEAMALRRLLEDFGMTHLQLGEAIGRSRTSVTNLLRLLDLDDRVKEMLASSDLEMGHARALLSLPLDDQCEVAEQVVARALSVRQTEQLVKSRSRDSQASEATRAMPNADIERLERELSNKLGVKTQIKHGGSGSGKVVINYAGMEELEALLKRLP